MPCTTLTVAAAAAKFEASISCSPSSITQGQSTTITVTVKNTGNATGRYHMWVTVDGSKIYEYTAPADAALGPGQTRTWTLTWSPPAAGTYTICAEVEAVA